jgi:putative transposase
VAVARVLQVTRQAIYRVPKTRPPAARRSARPADETDAAIVDVALANQTDGYRMVTALVVRKLGRAVNRKRVLRVMRERRLIQRRPKTRSSPPARLLPGHPAQRVWHLDMTSVWVAEHGWCYLMAAIDCCTREIVGWHPELRCRATEAIALIERAAAERAIVAGTLTLGTDNGSAFTARTFKLVLSGLGIAHRRGGYRDPESQAFIESWFSKLKERWRPAARVRDPRPGRGDHRRPHRPLPAPPAQQAQLQDTRRGRPDLGRCPRRPTSPSGLSCQPPRGAVQRAHLW